MPAVVPVAPDDGFGREFGCLWRAAVVSLAGTAVTDTLIPLIAAVSLHASPAWVGSLVALQTLPSLVVRIPAGLLADRLIERRVHVMMACDAVRAVAVGCIPLLYLLDRLTVVRLAVVVVVGSAVSALFRSLASVAVPASVPDRLLPKANGRMAVAGSVADVSGPGIAALLLKILAPPLAMFVDAISYVISLILLRPATRMAHSLSGTDVTASSSTSSTERLPWQSARRRYGVLVLALAVVSLCNGVALGLLAVYATRVVDLHASDVSLLLAIGAVGGLVGGALAPAVLRRTGQRGGVAVSTLLAGSSVLGLSVGANTSMATVGIIAYEFVGSFSAVLLTVGVLTVVQRSTPRPALGRTLAGLAVAFEAAAAMGAMLGGQFANVCGSLAVLRVDGAASLASALLLSLTIWRRRDAGWDAVSHA